MAATDRVVLSMNAGPKGRAGQGGTCSTRGNSARLTAGNIVAQDAAVVAWSNAAQALTQATVVRYATDHGQDTGASLPTAPQNKGEKWVVTMVGSVDGRKFTHSIPSADESGTHKLPNTLDYNPADADWIAYVTAANALLQSPDGESLSFLTATLLTRRR
jgi:hypothetical protein